MKDHEGRRSASVYAVLAIAGLLAAAIVWLGFRSPDIPSLPPMLSWPADQHGAVEDIRPIIVRPPICDEERPCS